MNAYMEGFEVVDAPSLKCKYAELFDEALECADEKCIAKTFDSLEEARKFGDSVKQTLHYWRRKNKKWMPLFVSRRGNTVFLAKEIFNG